MPRHLRLLAIPALTIGRVLVIVLTPRGMQNAMRVVAMLIQQLITRAVLRTFPMVTLPNRKAEAVALLTRLLPLLFIVMRCRRTMTIVSTQLIIVPAAAVGVVEQTTPAQHRSRQPVA